VGFFFKKGVFFLPSSSWLCFELKIMRTASTPRSWEGESVKCSKLRGANAAPGNPGSPVLPPHPRLGAAHLAPGAGAASLSGLPHQTGMGDSRDVLVGEAMEPGAGADAAEASC